ncbi:MAG: cation-translocating P-type ATPase [Clostridiales bacterium]|jgi:Ca2+-transporting ATPase|nr:cation-translocating P-type ATPase [Clostridiales bacterium]
MFSQKTIDESEKELGADINSGLTVVEAGERLEKYGANELKQKKPKTYFQMFIAQLNEPMIYILLAAMAVCIFLNEISDSMIILAVILINAIIGVVQEGKAQAALEALKRLTVPVCLVRRAGVVQEISAPELVPGDVVVLEAGRQIPADLRLIFTSNLKVDESALTGESVPVEKDAQFTAAKGENLPLGDRANMAYMTTQVTYGRGEGVVCATGMKTEIGKIAKMIDEADETMTPLQKRLADLGKLLGVVTVAICALLFLVAIIRDKPIAEMLITAISLAVAAVPEGLPAIVTIVLALGVQRLVKVNTIIKRLPAVETLGAVTVVCSDKTGTLTQNRMTVVKQSVIRGGDGVLSDVNDEIDEELLQGFLLCNDAVISDDGTRIGDPTETAFLDLGLLWKTDKVKLDEKYPRISEKAFDSVRKMMTTLHETENGRVAYTKGAADEILKRCTHIRVQGEDIRAINKADLASIHGATGEMAQSALRVLALARREYEKGEELAEDKLIFVGLMGMMDPPRPEAANAVRIFKKAGVKTVMITGDHKETAFAIAHELGIAETIEQCMEGSELDAFGEGEAAIDKLAERIGGLCVFARVSPEHKVMIVKALKNNGNIVSMTGDGVNDAPSLKNADIGVAMGITGTDVAKSAADMVLTDDNFATIEKAIEEGRGIYENIRKAVLFMISSNFGEIVAMLTAILSGLAAPLRATQILWVNLITDSLPGLALGADKNAASQIMSRKPRDPKEHLFARGGIALTVGYGAIIGIITMLAFIWGSGGSLERGQTYAFTVLALSELFHAIGMRDVRRSVFRMNHAENKLMIAAFLGGVALQVAATEIPFLNELFKTTPLSGMEWLYLAALSLVPLVVHELCVVVFMLKDRTKSVEK